ncbi:MAG: Asp-tRNA(Asn)/Glu-tRNA(Gln) amidotransferase subunit GatB [bacterium]
MNYETVIGLEVHAQLKTNSKIFCGCDTTFGAPPNTHTCPICLGHPGVLPVLNKRVLEYAIKTSRAVNCKLNKHSQFARKNYFYPDLPKAYQISQYELPLSEKGHLDIQLSTGEKKRIGITRIHMEEDAGKLIHDESFVSKDSSLVDFNRAGVPLIEIVSEPDLSSPEEARTYLENLKMILEYLEVCDCNMEEGSLRCDANISIRPVGQEKLGTKAELKNMNSFRNLQKALEYEISRQTGILEGGGKILQETRLWDAIENKTISMRSKEEAHDYRYFPEPDLVSITANQEWIEEISRSLPELPLAKKGRFIRQYNIPEYDAGILTSSKDLADYYEESVKAYNSPKLISNWIMGDLLRELKNTSVRIEDCKIKPGYLAKMVEMIDKEIISGKIAKDVFEEMFKTGKIPEEIVKDKGLQQIANQDELVKIVEKVIVENPGPVNEFLGGKEQTFGFLVGQVMKASRGKANPKMVNQILRERLK